MVVSPKPALLFPLFLIGAARAYTTFITKCEYPPSSFNYVSGPDTRGSLKILWSSLFTIFACTWTIQHPNVPEQRNGRLPGWRGDTRWGAKRLYESLKLALITVIAPEAVVMIACSDLLNARLSLHEMKRQFAQDQPSWTLCHSHFANMGGFVIRTTKPESLAGSAAGGLSPSGGYSQYHLTALNILRLRQEGVLAGLPPITDEIYDRSKGDAFVKAVAVAQILWSTVEITTRVARGLPIALLELTTLAFAACAIIIYALYWRKPKMPNTTVPVLDYQGEIPEPVFRVLREAEGLLIPNVFSFLLCSFARKRGNRKDKGLEPGSAIPPLAQEFDWSDSMTMVVVLVGAAATVFFGAIHLTAWHFNFPSTVDQLAWRCASIYVTSYAPVLLLLPMPSVAMSVGLLKSSGQRGILVTYAILSHFYILARLVMWVEIFRSFLYLPPGAFIETWASNIPHFA
jgi:hypothetical protein